ncbi:MAG TPA: cytochrome c1 [Acetobacteraceae bacterium]|nr:cytochrome c1 [Acetobacteraceae bacterium]
MMRRLTSLALFGALLAAPLTMAAPAFAQDTPPVPPQQWSFSGLFGTYDQASLQRGFQVYKEVCSSCHSMEYLHYRDLSGIGLNLAQIKAIAASVQVPGGIDKSGQPFSRPGRPADTFKAPFPNAEAAQAAFGGALPPDQSLLVNALPDGPNFIYAILNGYAKPPPGLKLAPGKYYNEFFPGHQISMPPPLASGRVTYADGTPASVPQMSHDVVTFLAWASNPEMDERKAMGVRVILFLALLTGLTYAVKRKIWSDVH